jgi:CheY-like chemotaxis protein
VLLDVLMPRLDGPQTLAVLQALEPEIVCCFRTGFPGQYIATELLARGARHLIAKPFHLPEAVALIQDLIDDQSSRGCHHLLVS